MTRSLAMLFAFLGTSLLLGCRAAPAPARPVGADRSAEPRSIEPAAPREAPEDPILAEFDGGEIRASELARYLLQVSRQNALGALSKMVGETVVEREAQRLGIHVPASVLAGERQRALGELEREAITRYGIGTTPAQFVETEFRESLDDHLASRLAEARRRYLVTRVIRFHSLTSERVVLRLCVLENEVQARQVAEQIRRGADFSEIAKRYSVHPSREVGGLLSPLTRESLNVAIADRAFSMAPGEVSSLLETEDQRGRKRFQIVRLEKNLPATSGSYADLRAEVERSLEQGNVDREEWTAWMLQLEKLYKVRVSAMVTPRFVGSPGGIATAC